MTVADVLARLQTSPGSPRLTWYAEAERVELSGAVLDNWVAKTVNLLVEELDAGPGTRVLLDLPVHWRTVVWALATWRAGACVVLPGGAGDGATGRRPDVAVSDRPGKVHPVLLPTDPGAVVAATLPALARWFDGELPAGAIDAAAAVMTYGDRIGWAPEVEPGAPAVEAPTRTPQPRPAGAEHPGPVEVVAHADLLTWAAAAATDVPEGARVAVSAEAAEGGRSGVAGVLRRCLGVLAAGGSVVLLDGPVAADPARVARILADERVTAGPG